MSVFSTSIDDRSDFREEDFFFALYSDLKLSERYGLFVFECGPMLRHFHDDMCRRMRSEGTEVLVELVASGEAFAGSKNKRGDVVEAGVEMGNGFPFFNRYRLETRDGIVSFVIILGSAQALKGPQGGKSVVGADFVIKFRQSRGQSALRVCFEEPK